MSPTTDQMDQRGRAVNSEGVTRDVIVIGVSAGGVEALVRLLAAPSRIARNDCLCVATRDHTQPLSRGAHPPFVNAHSRTAAG
jgi:hypothetical protein